MMGTGMRQRSSEEGGFSEKREGEVNTNADSERNWSCFVKGKAARRVKRARDKRTTIGK
jgi:hypothetical protein